MQTSRRTVKYVDSNYVELVYYYEFAKETEHIMQKQNSYDRNC